MVEFVYFIYKITLYRVPKQARTGFKFTNQTIQFLVVDFHFECILKHQMRERTKTMFLSYTKLFFTTSAPTMPPYSPTCQCVEKSLELSMYIYKQTKEQILPPTIFSNQLDNGARNSFTDRSIKNPLHPKWKGG